MSCIEYKCLICGYQEFGDGKYRLCPKCGGVMRMNWEEYLNYEPDLAERID